MRGECFEQKVEGPKRGCLRGGESVCPSGCENKGQIGQERLFSCSFLSGQQRAAERKKDSVVGFEQE